MLSVIKLNVIMLSVAALSAVMLSVDMVCCCTKILNTECYYAESPYSIFPIKPNMLSVVCLNVVVPFLNFFLQKKML